MWDKRARLVRVIDGDTLVATLDPGARQTWEWDVRLFGVWAPELNEPGGEESKAYVKSWLDAQVSSAPNPSWPFIVESLRMVRTDREQMTLTRYVCMVYSADRSRCLNIDVQAYIGANGWSGGSGS